MISSCCKKYYDLKRKIKNKNVIIYGAGKFFEDFNEKGLFDNSEVLGICDKKFVIDDEKNNFANYKIISINNLITYNPDFIVLALKDVFPVIKELDRLNIDSEILFCSDNLFRDSIKILLMKQKWLNRILHKSSNKVVLVKSNGKKVYNPRIKNLKIKFHGKNNYIEIHEPLKITREAYISCGTNCQVIINKYNQYNSFKLYAGSYTKFEIGQNTTVEGAIISMKNALNTEISIGSNCMLSYGLFFRTSDTHSIYDIDEKLQLNLPKNIKIGNHVWIASDCKILKGVEIPANCIIGTSSIVTKAFKEENCIITGIPAKIIKSNVNWDRRGML